MTLFDFYVDLRNDLLEQVTGVRDSNGYLTWDDTRPNYLTKGQLERLRTKHILRAQEFGVYLVTRYSSCANRKHEGYPTENRYGMSIPYHDERFSWGGNQFYQGERLSTCPCSPKNQVNNNQVIDELVYDKAADQQTCETIDWIFHDITKAIRHSGDKRTRSAIRECLLRAVLRINDAILPQTIDAYIATVKRLHRA